MLYSDYLDSVFNMVFGWLVVVGKSWLVVDQESGIGYYQYLWLDIGVKGYISFMSVVGVQVCLVELYMFIFVIIMLILMVMDSVKNVVVVEKGSVMLLMVMVKDSSGNLVVNVGFMLLCGDLKNWVGMVVMDGDVVVDVGVDDFMFKELIFVSVS